MCFDPSPVQRQHQVMLDGGAVEWMDLNNCVWVPEEEGDGSTGEPLGGAGAVGGAHGQQAAALGSSGRGIGCGGNGSGAVAAKEGLPGPRCGEKSSRCVGPTNSQSVF